MVVSYMVGSEELFKELKIDIRPGTLTLITGYEGMETYILSGIIAGLFPIEIDEFVEPLNEILKYFNGKLTVHSGWLPAGAVYVGRDPEKHILFSRVYEEIKMRSSKPDIVLDIMETLGMGEDFINRKISTLSGGEMMKLILSLALAKKSELYVLHGIFGWLDKTVKLQLTKILIQRMQSESGIVVIDEEYAHLLEFASKSYFFDGKDIHPDGQRELEQFRIKISNVIDDINALLEEREDKNNRKLVFRNVSFSYTSVDKERSSFSLKGASFNICNNRIYALIGRNGSGKSTVAKLICRVHRPDSGEILLNGRALVKYTREELVKEICYVGQFPEHQLVYSSTGEYKRAARKNRNEFSFNFLQRYFKESIPISLLSPYQMKVLLLLSNIWDSTELIILDEPTWGIGLSEKAEFYRILKEIVESLDGVSILIITHSSELLENLDCSVIEIENGVIREV